ncbi:glutamine transport system permease protein GlnP [Rhodococcus aetherivorans]|uniref:Glutamine transport system permease protein GlnP n=2 Tax=Rhodococcus aetherivorans TaxID=191292 RepID=A0ABQ0YSM6_9NOCA|nr:amino acid ABC transporter substrate-binding protein/permease [Rhodococcus aetherivorans]PND53963.1 glutamine ABC transporter permease [Rhodococcus sp. ENV425]QIX49479.1 ABC transporter permease subunit [Rhodococcus sp. DMU1]QSE58894.1 amino acid ABC transporter substrate-binding protein/permease [Rhodococcus sp. PSBB066]QSE69784.1 amino acid ABC transporter substrate-binding protein/permease [Rhodococcus sp. PSBB049]USC16750.1 amino acid ABC transporter substrate-binding protein/permease [
MGDRIHRPPARRSAALLTLLGMLGALLLAATPAALAQSPAAGRTYVIATDVTFAPFEFQNEQGDFVGIDMDLIREIAEDQGFTVEVRPLGFDAALQAVQADQADGVIAGMSITEERKQVFDFSDPYFESGVQMAVLAGNDEVASYADLAGKRVAVKNGTEGAAFAESIKGEYGFTTVYFADSASMYDEVRTGNSVAVFDDYPVLAYGIAQGNGLKTVTEKEAGANYGFAVNKGRNPELLTAFNAGLQNLRDNGRYDEIVESYLGEGAVQADNSIPGLLRSTWQLLLEGLWLTLVLSVVSIAIALVLGALFGLMRVSRNIVLRGIGTAYVDVFRGTPLLVQAFFIYFGIPAAAGFQMSAFTAGIITLSLNAGAYMAEIVRGGILSVDKGQMEAARSLGIGYLPAMRKVVMPQAVRTMIPSYINQFVITLKDTSILSVIGIAELTQTGRIIIARNFQSFQMWLIIGVIYFVVIMALTKLSDRLEKRINR